MQTRRWLWFVAATVGLGLGANVSAAPAIIEKSPGQIAQYPEGVVGTTPQTLPVGVYGAVGSAYNSSWRNVARDGDRFCVEIGNGPPSPYGGAIRILVSSLSLNDGVFYIDALNRPILTGQPYESLPDDQFPHYVFGYDQNQSVRRGLIWRWWNAELRGDPSRSDTCLQASGSYQAYQCVWKDGSRWDETIQDFRPWTEAEKQEELASCQANPNF